MIFKKNLRLKAFVIIAIFAVAASSIVIAATKTPNYPKSDAPKSTSTNDQTSKVTADVKTASPSENIPPAATTSGANTPDKVSSSTSYSATSTSNHGVGLLKSANPIGYVNENITYSINVFNPSDYNLTDINVTDTMLNLNATIPFMAVGNTTGVTYVFNRTILANDTNPLINTASVEAIDSEGVRSTATTQAKTNIMQKFLDIQKSGPVLAHELDPIKYTITVKNVGNDSLSNVTVTDEKLGFSWMGDLSINETNVFTLTYVVPKNSSSTIVNTAIASAMINGTETSAEASWTVTVIHPKLQVDKTVAPVKIWKDKVNVTYKIVVTNVGDTMLSNLTLVDSVYGAAPAELIPSSLLPGQSITWSFNATVKAGATNFATATGVDVLGRTVSASAKISLCFQFDDHHEDCRDECKDD
jgi:hypothetical protein